MTISIWNWPMTYLNFCFDKQNTHTRSQQFELKMSTSKANDQFQMNFYDFSQLCSLSMGWTLSVRFGAKITVNFIKFISIWCFILSTNLFTELWKYVYYIGIMSVLWLWNKLCWNAFASFPSHSLDILISQNTLLCEWTTNQWMNIDEWM